MMIMVTGGAVREAKARRGYQQHSAHERRIEHVTRYAYLTYLTYPTYPAYPLAATQFARNI